MMNEYFSAGFFSHDVINLSAREAFELSRTGALIIDVRETYMNSFKMFGIEEIMYLPYSTLPLSYNNLPRKKQLIFADAVGLHSREAVLFMIKKGYRNVANLCGGIVQWEKDGFPVITDKSFRLSGSCMCQLKPKETGNLNKNKKMEKTLGFIGGGRITRIFLQAFNNKNVRFKDIVVTDPDKDALEKLKTCYSSFRIADPAVVAAQDIVFISLHPPVILNTLENIRDEIRSEATVISLAPKITIAKMASILSNNIRLARMIPNATSIINEGYNPVCFAADFPETEKSAISEILGMLGTTFEVPETKLESYAIMSAMLPTYFWFQWQELSLIGQKMGLTEEESRDSINKTILASLDVMFKSGLNAEEIMDLIPVKPIGKSEPHIKEIYNSKLTVLYEKIKP